MAGTQGLASGKGSRSFPRRCAAQNQDGRGLMLDGEALLVVSGEQAAAALPDFYFSMARTTWVERQAELDRYIPMYSPLVRWIARHIRYML